MGEPPFGFDAPEESPGFLLWQVTSLWQRLIRKLLEPYDISHAQFVIMAILLWFEGQKIAITQVEIVKLSKLDKMTVSKSLKKLIMSGLIERQESIVDARAKTARLTNAGKALTYKLVPLVEAIDADFFRSLKDKESHNFIKSLRKIVDDSEKEETPFE